MWTYVQVTTSVPHWHFETDQLFSSVAFKMPIEIWCFFAYFFTVGTFTSVLKNNNLLASLKTVKTKVFLSFARFCGIFRVVQIIDQEHCTAIGNKTLGETKKMTRLGKKTYWRFHVGGVVLLKGGQLSPLHGGSGAPLRHNLGSKLQKINTVDERPVMRIRDVYSGSWFLSIPDPGSNNRTKRRGKVFFVIFCSRKYHKIVNSFICFWTGKANL